MQECGILPHSRTDYYAYITHVFLIAYYIYHFLLSMYEDFHMLFVSTTEYGNFLLYPIMFRETLL